LRQLALRAAKGGQTQAYRPIIELKLTGPAEQRDAMLALWPEVRKVAGDSLISGAPADRR
jgi:hypothetical protein